LKRREKSRKKPELFSSGFLLCKIQLSGRAGVAFGADLPQVRRPRHKECPFWRGILQAFFLSFFERYDRQSGHSGHAERCKRRIGVTMQLFKTKALLCHALKNAA